jgi:hypothetical protein
LLVRACSDAAAIAAAAAEPIGNSSAGGTPRADAVRRVRRFGGFERGASFAGGERNPDFEPNQGVCPIVVRVTVGNDVSNRVFGKVKLIPDGVACCNRVHKGNAGDIAITLFSVAIIINTRSTGDLPIVQPISPS